MRHGIGDQPQTHPTPTESSRLPYATKAQREPLIKAVCHLHLVSVANAKGRALTYENAHNIINLNENGGR